MGVDILSGRRRWGEIIARVTLTAYAVSPRDRKMDFEVSRIHRWRKTTDINRQHALFELLDGETSLLDAGYTDKGVFEVSFDPGISGKVMEMRLLLGLLEEGRALADLDR